MVPFAFFLPCFPSLTFPNKIVSVEVVESCKAARITGILLNFDTCRRLFRIFFASPFFAQLTKCQCLGWQWSHSRLDFRLTQLLSWRSFYSCHNSMRSSFTQGAAEVSAVVSCLTLTCCNPPGNIRGPILPRMRLLLYLRVDFKNQCCDARSALRCRGPFGRGCI